MVPAKARLGMQTRLTVIDGDGPGGLAWLGYREHGQVAWTKLSGSNHPSSQGKWTAIKLVALNRRWQLSSADCVFMHPMGPSALALVQENTTSCGLRLSCSMATIVAIVHDYLT